MPHPTDTHSPYACTRHTRDVERRWPGWVYNEGDEPDPRFSFANERTYLAWVRTALAMLAGGVALQALPLEIHPTTKRWLSVLFILVAMVAVSLGWLRWARSERAMRLGAKLPGSVISAFLAAAVVVAALVLLIVVTFQ